MVSNAAMVGDKHKFACVLISPNFAALEGWAKGQGVATSDRAALVKDAKVVADVPGDRGPGEWVDCALRDDEANRRGAGGVVGGGGGVDSEYVKLKRRVVEKKYEREIGEFYKDEASSKAS